MFYPDESRTLAPVLNNKKEQCPMEKTWRMTTVIPYCATRSSPIARHAVTLLRDTQQLYCEARSSPIARYATTQLRHNKPYYSSINLKRYGNQDIKYAFILLSVSIRMRASVTASQNPLDSISEFSLCFTLTASSR